MKKWMFLLPALSLFAADGSMPVAKTDSYKPYYYTKDSSEWFGYGEYLFWQPYQQDALAYVDRREITNNGAGLVINDDKIHNLSYQFENGFRIGGGYRFERDSWDVSMRPWQFEWDYTQLISRLSAEALAEPNFTGVQLVQTITTLAPIPTATLWSAKSHAKLKYRQLNTKLAWPLWVGKNVIMRLMVGSTYAWLGEQWNTDYTSLPSIANPRTESARLGWRYHGGGLLGGTDIYMSIMRWFGFYADSSYGLLVGRMQVRENYGSVNSIGGPFTFTNSYRTFTRFQPYFRLGAGGDYKYWFKNCCMLQLAIGYEWMVWFDMNQFGRVNERCDQVISGNAPLIPATTGNIFSAEPSSLGFHGMTVRAGLDY